MNFVPCRQCKAYLASHIPVCPSCGSNSPHGVSTASHGASIDESGLGNQIVGVYTELLSETMRRGLAAEMDVEPEDIDEDLLCQMMSMGGGGHCTWIFAPDGRATVRVSSRVTENEPLVRKKTYWGAWSVVDDFVLLETVGPLAIGSFRCRIMGDEILCEREGVRFQMVIRRVSDSGPDLENIQELPAHLYKYTSVPVSDLFRRLTEIQEDVMVMLNSIEEMDEVLEYMMLVDNVRNEANESTRNPLFIRKRRRQIIRAIVLTIAVTLLILLILRLTSCVTAQ